MLDIRRLCQPMQFQSGWAALLLAVALLGVARPANAAQQTMLPVNELLSETRRARDAKQFDRAEQLAREGMARFQDPVWPLTLALILADKGLSNEALAVLRAPWPGGLPHVERLMAEGYANRRSGDVWAALTAFGEVLLIQPANSEAREAVADLLDRIRAPFGAAAIEGINPHRDADQAAALVRWGEMLHWLDPAKRFSETDKALARLNAAIANTSASQPIDEALLRRLRVDRMLALRDRYRMTEVITEASALTASGVPLPNYGLHALADALLYERRPEESLGAYEAVLKTDPNNLQAQYGRVFSLIETERLSEAVKAVDAILDQQPPFRVYAGGAPIYPNAEYTYAATLAAQARLWSNDVAGGYSRLRALSQAAPASVAIRRALASAMNARGWPRAAEQEAAIAASLDPGSLDTNIMLAETALSRSRLETARAEADKLMVLAPENQQVRRFSKEVAAAQGWLLEAEIGPKWNEGGGSNASGKEWTSSIRLETPRVAGPLGLFVLSDAGIAHPPEGRASRYRAGGGIAFRGIDVSGTVFAAASWGSLSRGGVGFTIDWQSSDQVSLGFSGETFSRETPLRAVLQGITANSLSARMSWRRDERTQLWAGAGLLSYSDGNARLNSSIVGEQKLWSAPHLDVRGRAGLWYSHNSQPGGPYFAPESELSGGAGLTIRHIAWRRYQKLFSHALYADLGFQDQKGFATDWTGSLRYEHRWRTDPWWEIYYSVLIDRRVYDGEPERGIGAVLGFSRRFP